MRYIKRLPFQFPSLGSKVQSAIGLRIAMFFSFLFLINSNIFAQTIWEPEGLNMPGAWNSWANPPATLALASSTEVAGGLVSVLTTGTRRYHTTIHAAAAGGDVVGGTHQFLFTSGPVAGAFNNKWAGVTVALNTIQTYTKEGATNNTITIANDKWYTVNWKDQGYVNTEAIFMETPAAPVTILWASDNFTTAGQNTSVFVKLSAAPTVGEKVFVRYTTDNWVTSSFVEATGGTTLYAATIPGGGVTATANNQYYAFTTTASNPTHTDCDMYTINYNNNYGSNYKFVSKYITMSAYNVQSHGWGPYMFGVRGVNYACNTHPCTSGETYNQAYTVLEWNDYGGVNGNPNCYDCAGRTGSGYFTSSYCKAYSGNMLNDTAGITVTLSPATLASFVNDCPHYKDYRTYAGTTGNLKVGGVTKLAVSAYRFDLIVHYDGSGITGSGWAQIDVAGSDARWVKEFDPYGTGQLVFDLESFSPVIQICYGTYNLTFKIRPTPTVSNQSTSNVGVEGGSISVPVSLPSSGISMLFTQASFGSQNGNGVFANQIMSAPSGSNPGGIENMAQQYWQLGTALDTFNTAVTFDLSSLGGINTPANLRILHRELDTDPWTVYADYTLVDATHLRANNVTQFSQWTIGSTSGNPLPVELEYFNSVVNEGKVNLRWRTATETNNYGFDIECKKIGESTWNKIGFVRGSGSSNAPKLYTYSTEVKASGVYQYRLKQVDNTGSYKYSQIIEVDVLAPEHFELLQNYPNPFNPTTTIGYVLGKESDVNLFVFNSIGEVVKSISLGKKGAGSYSYELNASDLNSGVYFYKLQAGSFTQVKKMAVLK